MGLFTRAIRPTPPTDPNDNTPAEAFPGTVGPPSATPGDPSGLIFEGEPGFSVPPPRIVPSAWSGWPEGWATSWGGTVQALGDTAWTCLDLNSSSLATMPPYLVDAPPSLDAAWLTNPEPGVYTSWEEFAKALFWDYQLGEAFVIATAYYATGWPARFHVVPPWTVQVEIAAGRRRYKIGGEDVTGQMLHIRYQGNVSDAHGHGPLEAGAGRLAAAEVLSRYATNIAVNGLIPSSLLEAPDELAPQQAIDLRDQWIQQRAQNPGMPAVLSGGLEWKPTQLDPEKMALLDLSQFNESRIAVLLGVPPIMVGLPSGGDSMTYKNVSALFDQHWRVGLRPKARAVMGALSEWLVPRGVRVEVNSDSYVQAEPLERAQTDQILNGIVDPVTGQPAKTVAEIRDEERLNNSSPANLAEGVFA